ncbi:MAG: hypothetical protein DMG30_02435 [Acidobacteria bacterium]|nr:MAG: hypothetical protein DMG30_02435 [Acidobacteriota bacterium]
MTFAFTQISEYLAFPRHYRHRYLEKGTRIALLIGGAVERAPWSACQNTALHYSNGDGWERMRSKDRESRLRGSLDDWLRGMR